MMAMQRQSKVVALGLALLAAIGCSGGPAASPAAKQPTAAAAAGAATMEKASVVINFALLLEKLGIKEVAATLPTAIDHIQCTLSNSTLLSAPQQATISLAGLSADSRATAIFSDLPVGDGYTLQVSLFSAAGLVIDRGQAGPLRLAGGPNPISVVLTLTSGTSPTLTFISGFANSTSANTTVVAGDTLTLNSGITDAQGVIAKVELWLDGTAAAHHTDGTLLFTWTAPDFASPFLWNTAGVTALHVAGLHTQVISPNHTLTFEVYDSLTPPPNNLISADSFPLTVVEPAIIDVRINGPTPSPGG